MLLEFDYTAMITFVLWLMGLVFFYFAENKRIQTAGLYILIAGIGLFTAYIANLWVFLDRAPLRTLGETRLWYTFFLSVLGVIFYIRWKYKWLIGYSFFMAISSLVQPFFSKTCSKASSLKFTKRVNAAISESLFLGISSSFKKASTTTLALSCPFFSSNSS